ncbi:hypothetical protein BDR26DRAFT_873731 [Obelidium mucronatum]|nr:hypothetical protein BDR26DRAFT_873731 [Obelidium mucronatum]
MPDFGSVAVYVRRRPNSFENATENLLPPAIADSLQDENLLDYRMVSDSPKQLLTIDVGPGSTEYIYGTLVLQPLPNVDYSNMAITVLFAGVTNTHFADQDQISTVCEIENYVLRRTDRLETSSDTKLKALPFVIALRPRHDSSGLPITFSSPSCSIYYFLRFTFYFPGSFRLSNDVTIPVKVVHPWLEAPPPNTPPLGPQEDGYRVVLDIQKGHVQGSTTVVRSGCHRGSDELLRPKVLSNLITTTVETTRRRGGRESIDSPPYRTSVEVDFTAPEYSPMEEMGRSSMAVERVQTDVELRESSNFASASFNSLPEDSSNGATVESDYPNSPPLAYSMEDPLVFMNSMPHLALPSLALPISPDFISTDVSATAGDSDERDLISPITSAMPSPPPKPKPGLLHGLFKRRANNAGDQQVPNVPPSPLSPGSLSQPPLSFITPDVGTSPPPEQQQSEPDSRPSTNPFLSMMRSKSAGANPLLRPVLRPKTEIPRYRILMPCTMFGPSSRIPIDILIKSLPLGHYISQIEIRLNAIVYCTAYGKSNEDVKELALADVTSGFEAVQSVDPNTEHGGVFKKRVWLEIPDAATMGQYATEFKVPLVTLRHRVVFRLVTEKKRRVGVGNARSKFNLGGISVVLLR